MQLELVEATTADGLALAGGLVLPTNPASATGDTDAVIMMHGNGGNFYHSFQRDFAQRLAAKGYAVLTANNRGHDILSQAIDPWGKAPPRPSQAYLGTALERIAECTLDWAAWLGYLSSRGFGRIALWGHSRGAVKAAYYLAGEHDDRVTRAILSSPPWFSYARWMASERAVDFEQHLSQARLFVDRGQPEALMWVTLPTEYVCGAASYLDSYGRAENYNVVHLLEEIACPVLAMTGTAEVASLFPLRGLPAALDEVCERNDHIVHVSIPDGDHMYSGRRGYVFDRVVEWLDAV